MFYIVFFLISLFQSPFKDVTYRIIGDDSAPVFFDIGQTDGNLKLQQSVNADTETVYKVGV